MTKKTNGKNRKWLRHSLWIFGAVFLFMNLVAFFQARTFTHFTLAPVEPTRNVNLGFGDKVKMAIFGIDNPRPKTGRLPSQPFKTVTINSTEPLEGWHLKTDLAVGTVILFHGYRSNKSAMLDHSDEFLKMGYNVLLVDFMGSGGSGGNTTTIGYLEGEQVKDSYEYVKNQGEENIVLCGISMGASAIAKAMSDYDISPKALILECPFGTFYEAVEGRFRSMGMPSMPMAPLLIFWGGLQHGFWAFSHQPAQYAKSITIPTLLLWGELDDRVTRSETEAIFNHLNGEKQLVVYPNSGHESYLNDHREEWIRDVRGFFEPTCAQLNQ